MVETLIVQDDRFRLYSIPTTPHEDWINFRVKTVKVGRSKGFRSRLSYNRKERRLSENKSTKSFRERNPQDLAHVISMIEKLIDNGY